MRIRLHGTAGECSEVAKRLAAVIDVLAGHSRREVR